jgi:hypothetical protein
MSGLQTGLGGPLGYGTLSLPRNDDGGQFIALGQIFSAGLRIGGQAWTGLWINTNGTISFGGALAGYGAAAIGAAAGPVIAAFAADVDTRLRGEGIESGVIWVHQVPGALTVTWADVGFFRRNTDLVNSFQVQIRASGGQDADVSLRYGAIEWVSGDLDGGSGGLGGSPALAGIKASGAFQPIAPSGDQGAWLSLPGPQAFEIILRGGVATILGDGSGGNDPVPPPGDGGTGDAETISGTVTDSDGAPMPGVTLRIVDAENVITQGTSDAAGAFALTLPASLDPTVPGLRLDVLRSYSAASPNAPDIFDVLSLFRLVAGATPAASFDPAARLAADYNGNGSVDIFDVLAIFRHVAGVPGALAPDYVFVDQGTLAEGFGPDPTRVPPVDDLPGSGLFALALEGPVSIIGILRGDLAD